MNNLPATLDDIRYAYRLLLGREPDPQGMEHHRKLIDLQSPAADELAKSFLCSAEFATRNNISPVEVALDGYSLFIRPDDRDIGLRVQQTRQYEPHVTAVLRDTLRPGDVFIDIGANIGFFTNMAAHLVGSDGLVIAVEPMDKNLQLIYQSLVRNGFNHVRVHACAVSDRVEFVCVATGPGTSNGQVLSPMDGGQSMLFTQTRRLDDIIGDLGRLDLVKMDIEGYEPRAWRGFTRTLAQHRPAVLTEFHPYCMRTHVGVDPLEYLGELFEYGGTVQVLPYRGGSIVCRTSAEVMHEWAVGDSAARNDGTNHLDLLIKPTK